MMQRLTSLPIHSVAHSIAASGIDAFPESGSHNYGFLLRMNERCEVFMNQDMNNLCQYTGRVSLCTPGHRLVRPLKERGYLHSHLPKWVESREEARGYFEADTQCEANAKEREL
jgi:hypothetical protein